MIVITCVGIMKVHKIHLVFDTAKKRWVKRARPLEPKYLTPTLLMGDPAGRRRLVYSTVILNHCATALLCAAKL